MHRRDGLVRDLLEGWYVGYLPKSLRGFWQGLASYSVSRGDAKVEGSHPARTMWFWQALMRLAKPFVWPCRHGQFRG